MIISSPESSPAVKAICLIIGKINSDHPEILIKPDFYKGRANGIILPQKFVFIDFPLKLYPHIVTALKVEMGFNPQKYKNPIINKIKIEDDKFITKRIECEIMENDHEIHIRFIDSSL